MKAVLTASKLMEEEALVRRLLARDEQALRIVYGHYSRNLLNRIRRLTSDIPLAEDVLQESLLNVWTNIASYEPERGRFYTWMSRICYHKAIDALRTKVHQFHSNTASLDTECVLQTPSIATFHPEYIGLRDMTKRLPPEQCHVINLLYFDGFTQVQVAEHLGIPLATVKSRARAGLRKLAPLIA